MHNKSSLHPRDLWAETCISSADKPAGSKPLEKRHDSKAARMFSLFFCLFSLPSCLLCRACYSHRQARISAVLPSQAFFDDPSAPQIAADETEPASTLSPFRRVSEGPSDFHRLFHQLNLSLYGDFFFSFLLFGLWHIMKVL